MYADLEDDEWSKEMEESLLLVIYYHYHCVMDPKPNVVQWAMSMIVYCIQSFLKNTSTRSISNLYVYFFDVIDEMVV